VRSDLCGFGPTARREENEMQAGRSDLAAIDARDSLGRLSLLSPELTARWSGIPVHWVSTPEGRWGHRFTPDATVLSLVAEGTLSARMSCQGRSAELDVGAGALAILNAGHEVLAEQRGCSGARRILVELDVPARVRDGLLDDDLATVPLRPTFEFHDPSLAAVLRSMVHEIAQGCPNGTLFAQSLSVGVAMHLCRTHGHRTPSACGETGKLSAWQWRHLNELIDSRLSNDLSLSDLSRSLGLSKPHFVRLFRNTAGTSPHRYVIQKRAEHAHHLIQSSNVPLVGVALEAGFANQSHLNRVFHRIYGITPGEARRRARKPSRY
jgi:AraC family transcriptional regulator